MAKTAITELQQQIEQVRREAFAAGYAAAMQAIRDLASRLAPGAANAAFGPRRGTGRSRRSTTRSGTTPAARRRTRASEGAKKAAQIGCRRRPAGAGCQFATGRGNPKDLTSAPRALRIAEIRKALLENGTEISFTSLRHALGQLEARQAAEQVGNSRTWRHRGGSS